MLTNFALNGQNILSKSYKLDSIITFNHAGERIHIQKWEYKGENIIRSILYSGYKTDGSLKGNFSNRLELRLLFNNQIQDSLVLETDDYFSSWTKERGGIRFVEGHTIESPEEIWWYSNWDDSAFWKLESYTKIQYKGLLQKEIYNEIYNSGKNNDVKFVLTKNQYFRGKLSKSYKKFWSFNEDTTYYHQIFDYLILDDTIQCVKKAVIKSNHGHEIVKDSTSYYEVESLQFIDQYSRTYNELSIRRRNVQRIENGLVVLDSLFLSPYNSNLLKLAKITIRQYDKSRLIRERIKSSFDLTIKEFEYDTKGRLQRIIKSYKYGYPGDPITKNSELTYYYDEEIGAEPYKIIDSMNNKKVVIYEIGIDQDGNTNFLKTRKNSYSSTYSRDIPIDKVLTPKSVNIRELIVEDKRFVNWTVPDRVEFTGLFDGSFRKNATRVYYYSKL